MRSKAERRADVEGAIRRLIEPSDYALVDLGGRPISPRTPEQEAAFLDDLATLFGEIVDALPRNEVPTTESALLELLTARQKALKDAAHPTSEHDQAVIKGKFGFTVNDGKLCVPLSIGIAEFELKGEIPLSRIAKVIGTLVTGALALGTVRSETRERTIVPEQKIRRSSRVQVLDGDVLPKGRRVEIRCKLPGLPDREAVDGSNPATAILCRKLLDVDVPTAKIHLDFDRVVLALGDRLILSTITNPPAPRSADFAEHIKDTVSFYCLSSISETERSVLDTFLSDVQGPLQVGDPRLKVISGADSVRGDGIVAYPGRFEPTAFYLYLQNQKGESVVAGIFYVRS